MNRNMFADDTDSNGVVSLRAARRTLGNLGGATDEDLRDAQEVFANAFGECVAERVKRRAAAEPEAKTTLPSCHVASCISGGSCPICEPERFLADTESCYSCDPNSGPQCLAMIGESCPCDCHLPEPLV